MSLQRTAVLAIVAAVASCIVGLQPTAAPAAPSAAQVASARVEVDRAVARLEAARGRAESLEARASEASEELDRVVAEQNAIRARLNGRSEAMYRMGDTGIVEVLLGARSFEDFATRWDLLARMNRRDAEDLRELEIAERKTAESAQSLIALQEQSARAVDAASREAAAARRQFKSSQTALQEYESRTKVTSTARRATPKRSDSMQSKQGTGAWKTAVASHYSRTFTGRGASGERIGPYSMMVAHKTLPFGTLVEIEYRGKRAVAKVADRGPYTAGRDFDLGPGVVRALDFSGVHEIRYRIIGR